MSYATDIPPTNGTFLRSVGEILRKYLRINPIFPRVSLYRL